MNHMRSAFLAGNPALRIAIVLGVAALALLVGGIAYAYNCVDTIKADSYWGTGSGGHYYDANLTCTDRAGLFYTCPDRSKYPVNGTARVGAIMVLEPGRCGAASYWGHVGIVTGVSSGSILVREQAWGPKGSNEPPGTHSHAYPCSGMWFIHRATSTTTQKPTVIVDDKSTAFKRYGPSGYWLTYGIGYGSRMFATWNNGPCNLGSSVCP